MYEVGRPRRLSVEEALEKEAAWQDFGASAALPSVVRWLLLCAAAAPVPSTPPALPPPPAVRFADARLQRSGRCHEREVLAALGREMPRYRSLDGMTLRSLVRNWAPGSERSSNGFLRGVSLRPAGGAEVAAAAPRAADAAPGDTAARPADRP